MLKGDARKYEGIPPKSDKYGVGAMAVGECLHIKERNSVMMAGVCDHFRKKYDRKYVVRKDSLNGCYIWRMK